MFIAIALIVAIVIASPFIAAYAKIQDAKLMRIRADRYEAATGKPYYN